MSKAVPMRVSPGCKTILLASALVAQGALAGPAAPQAPARATAASAAAAATDLRVIEDDRVRIEETRVRGQVQRITVAPKGPVGSTLRPYEIQVGAGGRDPSQDRSAAGQRVWSVLKF
ncbi:MAG: hypothetical protein JNL30_02665 [Rubrivivax sp.]|nr:hypothetical protein [Rubrivivax sp.]